MRLRLNARFVISQKRRSVCTMKMGKIAFMLKNVLINTEFRWDNNAINHAVEKIILCGKTFHATVTAQKARHIT